MDLFNKLNILEEKIDKIISETLEIRSGKEALQKEYDDLQARFQALEEELKNCRDDKETARQRVEEIIRKLG